MLSDGIRPFGGRRLRIAICKAIMAIEELNELDIAQPTIFLE